MALAHIYDVRRNICLYHKQGVLMSSDIKALSLTNCIELRSVMLSDYLSERIFLVSGLLDVLPSASVCLCLETDIIGQRLRKAKELVIRQHCNLIHIKWAIPLYGWNSLIL